jgi:molybdopterin molybdotransferase
MTKLDNPLISVETAKLKILEKIEVKSPETYPLHRANGLVLAGGINAPMDLPPFNNSSMDGFAVLAEDTSGANKLKPIRLQVIEDIPAGHSPNKQIHSGETSRIMTGAPLPSGANAVIPVENTNFSERYSEQDLPEFIEIYREVFSSDYVRPKGQDLSKGTALFDQGHVLRPQDLGLLSGLGLSDVSIHPQPNIALISSGDEIIKPGNKLEAGKIYDMNSISIRTLLQSFGANVIDVGIAKDDYEDVFRTLEKTREIGVDLIVSTAGVSVGVFDYINRVLEDHGEIDFWRINMRPGKPLLFGRYGEIPFVGLPGNPVSAFVSSRIFLKPVIKKFAGKDTSEKYFDTFVDEDMESDGRETYLRVSVSKKEQNFHAVLSQHQGSGNIYSLVCSNALLIMPAGVKSLPKGSTTKFMEI